LAEAMVGREIKALVEQPLIARSAGDAPEVDTRVLLTSNGPVGEFVQVRITGTQVYDLRGEICDRGERAGTQEQSTGTRA
jgi:ribosomal protein S12 methylthiotransferase